MVDVGLKQRGPVESAASRSSKLTDKAAHAGAEARPFGQAIMREFRTNMQNRPDATADARRPPFRLATEDNCFYAERRNQ